MSNSATARITHLSVRGLFAGWTKPASPDNPASYVSKHINFEVSAGEILAIMGPSGAGKSTLLEALFGRVPFRKGRIFINGEDVTRDGLQCVSKRVGLVPQKDELVEELTYRENVRYFHKIAVDSRLGAAATEERIENDLDMLGLTKQDGKDKRKVADRPVSGSSGGQKKRGNIAMELINDPDILIIDEPTSGLSSQDSLDLVTQLRNIAAKGKIVIIIIHQPSSEIFKQFDRVMLLDNQGYCVRSGKAMEVLKHFAPDAECSRCGKVDPDKMLAVINARNESRQNWATEAQSFESGFEPVPPAAGGVQRDALIRSPFRALEDLVALIKRQWLIRSRDRMSQLITYAAPPLLGFLIASVFKATPDGQGYSFAANALYPQALFMLIIGAMFLGMVSTIFEVIKDRDIFKRERQRGLSPAAYFFSELVVAATASAIQCLLLVSSALYLLDASEMLWRIVIVTYLAQLISIAIGLLLSTLFSTPIGAYNLIILVLLPQIILGGALLPYKDMGKEVYLWETRDSSRRPLLGALMPASWAYQMAIRLNYDAMRDLSVTRNMAIGETEYLKPGSFLSPRAERVLTPSVISNLPALTPWERAHIHDGLLLLLMFVGITGSGFIWIYKTTHGRTRALWVMQGCLLASLPAAYGQLTQTNTRQEGRAISYIASVSPQSWPDAAAYCKARRGELANAPEMATIFNGDKSLKAGSYWTRETEIKEGDQHAWSLKLARMADKPVARERDVLKESGTMESTPRLLQKFGFVCIVPTK